MISSHRIEEIIKDCLYNANEIVDGKPVMKPVVADGILRNFGFHPIRLESHREEVRAMLMELPPEFMRSKGGGMTFLNACMTKDGELWGQHENMEQLFVLGIGLKLATWCLPKDMWSSLPGGMPYVTVND